MKCKFPYQVTVSVVVLLVMFCIVPLPAWGDGNIQGFVMKEGTMLGIEGALIEADSASTTSNINGFYSLSLSPGVYDVTASATGFVPQSVPGVEVFEGTPTSLSFFLSPTPLKLDAAYPTLGIMGQNLDVTLKGTAFDENTRVSMSLDSGNRMALVGSVDTPGYANNITVSGSYAYVAEPYNGLQVIDISTPSNPQIIGSLDTPDTAEEVAVSGSYAYIASYQSGLQVIDISTPSDLQIIGSRITPGYANGVTVSGSYAYVADYYSLQIIDISTPSNPQIIGSGVDTPGSAYGVAVSGSYAYVADGNSGLQVIDISTPSSLQIIGSVGTPTVALDVTVSGSYAYVAATESGLQVVDISTPSNPQIVRSVDTPDRVRNVAVSGHYAYATDRTTGIQVVDISTPTNARIIGTVDTPGSAYDVAVSGGYAYVGGNVDGLHVIDISTVLNPQTGSVVTHGEALSVTVFGTYAYLGDTVNGLLVIDISTPSNPQMIGSVDTPGGAHDVAVAVNQQQGDTYAYVADFYELQVIDINTPSAPQIIGSVEIIDQAKGVAVSGSYAYVAANYHGGLQVVDISTPSNPQIIHSVDTPGYAVDVAISGGYAYVASAGLQVVDISTPSNSHIVGSVDTPGYATDVAVSGSYAYVADDHEGLQVLDISTPSNPQIVGSVSDNFPDPASGVAVSGNYAYVSFYETGVQAIDISTPSAPKIIGSVDTPGLPWGITVSGSYAYVAERYYGLTVVPVPVEIGSVTAISDTELSVSLPSPIQAGRYTLRVFNDNEKDELPGAVSFTDDPSILNTKAIIMAGGGPNASGGTIWEETKLCANKAYDALILQGYEHDSIYYMSMEAGNDYVDSSNPATFLSDLSNAINTWAADASQLLVFFADHGQTEQFVLYADDTSSQTLSAQELDGWLDSLQQTSTTLTGPVIFAYDACQSGSFVSKMRPPIGEERIVITGSAYEPAYFLGNGETSFSFQFWDETLLNAGNLGRSFSDARDMMQSYQSALLEANWDFEGNTNESEDISIADDKVIRRGTSVFIGVHPYITWVSDPEIISTGTSATIWASGVVDAESVHALIVPPDVNPETSDIPISDLPTIELTDPDGDHVYNNVYAGFDKEGTYVVVIKAQASQEIYSYVQDSMITQTVYSPPMYTSVTKTIGDPGIDPDSYEEDDIYSQANVIVLNDYTPQSHNFHDAEDTYGPGDVDWVKFYGLSGEIYKIKAYNLGIVCDVVIALYDSSDTNLLAGPKNDAGLGEDEYIEWTCPQEGVYYVKISNANANFGENVKYDLKVFRPIGGEPGNLIGEVTDSMDNGIGNAVVKSSLGSTISYPNGYYFLVLPSGTHTITVSASGFAPAQADVTIQAGNDTTRDFELNTDTDGDGIPDSIDTDDDNDGMPDDWEVHYSLNPLADDAAQDPDSDTYTNLQEYQAGSDPKNASSYPKPIKVQLNKGFNLIAIPAEVSYVNDLRDWLSAFGGETEIEKVMVYDAQTGKYLTLIPEDPINPSVILQGNEGLIVYANQDKKVSFTSLHCSTLDLSQGFNLIGIACPPEGDTAFQLLNALGSTNVTSIQRYSTNKGMFDTAGFDQSSNPSGVDFPIMAGEGYFIYMKQEVLDFSF